MSTIPPAAAPAAMNPRTRMLLQAPIVPTLLRLAWPNVLVMLAQAAVGMIETWWISVLGTDALHAGREFLLRRQAHLPGVRDLAHFGKDRGVVRRHDLAPIRTVDFVAVVFLRVVAGSDHDTGHAAAVAHGEAQLRSRP